MKPRIVLGVLVVTAMFILSGCWVEDTSPADPGYQLHHSFSLQPGLAGFVTDCYDIHSSVQGRTALCRIVEGYEEISGQGGNWDVKFDGGDHPVAENCVDLFWAGCTIVAPNGMTYEGCYPYMSGGTKVYWCDYRTSHWFVLTTNSDPWHYVLHVMWNWSLYVGLTPAQCAYGIVSALALQQTVDNDWLVSCADGPM